MQMVAKSNKVYEVTSRLIVGGRVYLPGTTVELNDTEGQTMQIRGFVRPLKVQAKVAPDAPKETVPPQQIGVVTKHEPSADVANPDSPEPKPTEPKQDPPAAPGQQVPVDKPQEQSNGKSTRKNR